LDFESPFETNSGDTQAEEQTSEQQTSEEPQPDTEALCPSDGGALSTCLTPGHSPQYYVEQAHKYFDTYDAAAASNDPPRYSDLVARWEWPPWLKLTGYGRQTITYSDKFVMLVMPSTIPVRDCRAFPVQPFARCRVTFDYDGRTCPIYEEFTFNDKGEMTFIEAWSDIPEFMPMEDETDEWGEGPSVHRLSTKIPGLGDPGGRISLTAQWMRQAAAQDEDVADFVQRAKNFWGAWLKEYFNAGSDLFERGCGW
jgi:hypothetical protein